MRTGASTKSKKGISWTVWVFDPRWSPQLISDWDYTPTTQGAFFKRVLAERLAGE